MSTDLPAGIDPSYAAFRGRLVLTAALTKSVVQYVTHDPPFYAS